jgi:hypothetical protein
MMLLLARRVTVVSKNPLLDSTFPWRRQRTHASCTTSSARAMSPSIR